VAVRAGTRAALAASDGLGMPIDISARQLRELLEQQVQLVEVLPAGEYEEEHLPGAINIPLKSFTSENLSQLDRYKPVVVYCWDDN
jgi:rhodanese-related sulfurtransferase